MPLGLICNLCYAHYGRQILARILTLRTLHPNHQRDQQSHQQRNLVYHHQMFRVCHRQTSPQIGHPKNRQYFFQKNHLLDQRSRQQRNHPLIHLRCHPCQYNHRWHLLLGQAVFHLAFQHCNFLLLHLVFQQ